jgi:hypothetical protein
MRLQRWENGPYFTNFSLHIPDMRSFFQMREIDKICPRSPTVLIEPVFRFRTPKSDRLLALIIGSRCRLVKNLVLQSGMHKNIFFLYNNTMFYITTP